MSHLAAGEAAPTSLDVKLHVVVSDGRCDRFGNAKGWVTTGESERLELKRTTKLRREGARAACAMLNHAGGRVVFGVDSDGRTLGQNVSDHTIEEVVAELREIDPPVFPSIDRVVIAGTQEAVVVTVTTGDFGPYSYRGQAYVGSATQVLRYHGTSTTESF